MTFAKRQAGLGVLGWLILILLVGGGVTVGLKLIPLYIDFATASKDMEAMARAPNMTIKSDPALRENLRRRFSIDNIENLDLKKDVTVKRTPEHVFVTLAYEVKQPLVGNVQLLVSFHKQVQLRN